MNCRRRRALPIFGFLGTMETGGEVGTQSTNARFVLLVCKMTQEAMLIMKQLETPHTRPFAIEKTLFVLAVPMFVGSMQCQLSKSRASVITQATKLLSVMHMNRNSTNSSREIITVALFKSLCLPPVAIREQGEMGSDSRTNTPQLLIPPLLA